MITSIQLMPRVSGTNRKWYIAVMANCHRDRSIIVSSNIERLPGWTWVKDATAADGVGSDQQLRGWEGRTCATSVSAGSLAVVQHCEFAKTL